MSPIDAIRAHERHLLARETPAALRRIALSLVVVALVLADVWIRGA